MISSRSPSRMTSSSASSPGSSLGDQPRQVGLAHDRLAVHGHDHVAAGVDLLALEVDRLVGGLDAGVIGGPPVGHGRDQRAGFDVEVQLIGELRVERLGRDPDEGVVDRAVVAKLLERAQREVDGHRVADALVAARSRC